MEEADPNNDEFECEVCKKILDIEDSIRINDVLVCVDCSNKE